MYWYMCTYTFILTFLQFWDKFVYNILHSTVMTEKKGDITGIYLVTHSFWLNMILFVTSFFQDTHKILYDMLPGFTMKHTLTLRLFIWLYSYYQGGFCLENKITENN